MFLLLRMFSSSCSSCWTSWKKILVEITHCNVRKYYVQAYDLLFVEAFNGTSSLHFSSVGFALLGSIWCKCSDLWAKWVWQELTFSCSWWGKGTFLNKWGGIQSTVVIGLFWSTLNLFHVAVVAFVWWAFNKTCKREVVLCSPGEAKYINWQ